MSQFEEKAIEYINEKLFTEEKPVLFTDLIFHFKVGPSRAKGYMYAYYKQNTVTKFNCIILCCYKNGVIKVIHDVNDVNDVKDQQALADCFIYAFNPMDKFIPVNLVIDQHECLTIRNPYKLNIPHVRSKTVEEEPVTKKTEAPPARSKTVPDSKNVVEKEHGKQKSTGLRSTAILAKMRADRENKEAQRQEGLKKRRDQQSKRISDPKRSAQMKELNNLFDEEEDEDEEVNQEEEPLPTKKERSEPIDSKDLEELLETTVEDSLIVNAKEQKSDVDQEMKKQEEPDSSYVDDDGYIVTNRVATSTPPQISKKRAVSTPTNKSDKKRATTNKKTQGTLENFFMKKSK